MPANDRWDLIRRLKFNGTDIEMLLFVSNVSRFYSEVFTFKNAYKSNYYFVSHSELMKNFCVRIWNQSISSISKICGLTPCVM